MVAHKLELAPKKAEVVVVKGSRNIRKNVTFQIRQQRIIPARSIIYLGIKLDDKLCFGEHVKFIVEKAERRALALSRLMPNIGGPQRVLLYMVVQSVLLHGAPIWYKVARICRYKDMLLKIQRKMLLRIVGAYVTVSTVALQVIASIAPLDLLVEERKMLYEMEDSHIPRQKRAARALAIQKWQERWDANQEKGQ